MKWRFLVISEPQRKSPHGIVVHHAGDSPEWVTANKGADKVFTNLFTRNPVYANIPEDGGYKRITKTFDDADYLDYAMVKMNLPLIIEEQGVISRDGVDAQEILRDLGDRLGDIL